MNACEDGTEPVGEYMDAVTAMNHSAVSRIITGAAEITAAVQLAERRGQALDAVRQLHRPYEYAGKVVNDYCRLCAVRMPCLTIRAIDEALA